MVNDIESQIAEQMRRIQQEAEEAAQPEVEEPPVQPEVEELQPPVVEATPLKVNAESIEAAPAETKAEQAALVQIKQWVGTRLHLVTLYNAEENEPVVNDYAGTNVYINDPFSVVEVEGVKVRGYYQNFLKDFVSRLKRVVSVDKPLQLGTEQEGYEYYKTVAVAIMQSISNLLPLNDRLQVFCNIVTEKNNLVDNLVLDFYVVYSSDAHLSSALTSTSKLARALAKTLKGVKDFEVYSTAATKLENMPLNLEGFVEDGWAVENYADTRRLPSGIDERVQILGALKDTKRQLRPHIVLSKRV